MKKTSGGYCGRVPPLPIPNREVKPACADGTAMQCGRVGGRLLSRLRLREPKRFTEPFSFMHIGLTGHIMPTRHIMHRGMVDLV